MLLIFYTYKLTFYYFLKYALFFQMCARLKIIIRSNFLNIFCFFQICARLKIIRISSKLKKTGVAFASLALMVEPPLFQDIK